MSSTKPGAEPGQYLSFFVADEEYAIGILKVKEILEFSATTKVPGAPRSIRGVANVRGRVVPVVDLAVRFSLPETVVTKRSCIVIVEVDVDGERSVMGVMADSVSQVISLGPDDIQPPPSFGTRVHIDYLLGMGRSGQKFLMILDIDRILTLDELLEVTKVQATAPEAEPSAPAATGEPRPRTEPSAPAAATGEPRPRTEPSAGRAGRDEDVLGTLVPSRPARAGGGGADRRAKE